MRFYYRILLASPLVGIINMSLISLSLAPTLADYIGIRRIWLMGLLPILALVFLAALGTILDWCKFQKHQEIQSVSRSPAWERLFDKLETIERKIK